MEKRTHRMESNGPNRITRDWMKEQEIMRERRDTARVMIDTMYYVLKYEFDFSEDEAKLFHNKFQDRIRALKEIERG